MFPKDYNFTNSIQSTATVTNAQHKVGRSFIRTEMKKYMIYTDSFGLGLRKLLGYRLPRSYKVAEIKRRITEGIMNKVPCVVIVKDWQFNAGIFYFTVVTNTGEEVKIEHEFQL